MCAFDINSSGQIVGVGIIGGDTHAFLMNPVPEPTTLLLFSIGAVMVCRKNV